MMNKQEALKFCEDNKLTVADIQAIVAAIISKRTTDNMNDSRSATKKINDTINRRLGWSYAHPLRSLITEYKTYKRQYDSYMKLLPEYLELKIKYDKLKNKKTKKER